jgi:CBS domain containing-hemolysin-like protein
VPETKKVAELLREMQHEKQHMRMVIDEYGGVAGLVTIEDLLEAIVGSIADEHDAAEATDEPVAEGDGQFVVPGSFEVSRLRELFAEQLEAAEGAEEDEAEEVGAGGKNGAGKNGAEAARVTLNFQKEYEATTIGGLVSEIAGHIPLVGEVVEEDGLRIEVLESTDRKVERVRVGLVEGVE